MRSRVVLAVLSLIAILSPLALEAGRKEGILAEFRKTEEEIRGRELTPEFRQKTLEANLQRAVHLAVSRRYHLEKKDLLKDLSPATFDYENPTSPTVYYVKFKNFVIRFDFVRDPELYIQSASYEKFLLIGTDGVTHTPEKPASP